MVVQIPGHISVSFGFFEEEREELEKKYQVGIDTGPGGWVEVNGEEDSVFSFLDDHGIEEYEEVEEEEYED